MDDDQLENDQADDKKHAQSANLSVASADSASALGSASEEETFDIDKTRKQFNESNDDNGPHELSAEED